MATAWLVTLVGKDEHDEDIDLFTARIEQIKITVAKHKFKADPRVKEIMRTRKTRIVAEDASLKHWVDICDREDNDKVIESIGPYGSERMAERAESGVNINMNHERYFTRLAKRAEKK